MRELKAKAGRLGASAEALAASLLERQGYRLLARNYRCAVGELDLVARDGSEIVFVEVRARQVGSMVGPEESITARKQQRVLRAAEHYLSTQGMHDAAWRVDVVAVEVDRAGRVVRAEHLRSVVQ
jgi:putative endonuclease